MAFDNTPFNLGAQNISEHSHGAHTGELSAGMIKETGCQYVLIGHSERRENHNESDEIVATKATMALDSGLTPIICVGEPLEIRESGQLESFLGHQLGMLLSKLSIAQLKRCIIAYEPIWAIGTGVTATPTQAQTTHQFIRHYLSLQDEMLGESMQLLYGGSVNAENAKDLFAQADIDGGLVGGASLNMNSFRAICEAAQTAKK